jgi:SpoVK/Ycf46/Vps4 family AAA+-type ATPase
MSGESEKKIREMFEEAKVCKFNPKKKRKKY